MTHLKKTLSVFLAAVMLCCVFTTGFYGFAAEVDYNTQYNALATALKNEHVRDLTNYTIENTTLENGAEGFDSEANGFAYEHRVTALDNSAGDILKAANRFYYIAESLISTKYGTGLYEPNLLIKHIAANLKPYFVQDAESDVIYEDFYGERYYPTEEELVAYKNAVSLIEASNAKVTKTTLSQFDIYFIEKNDYEYYNVETLLQYFMGNVLRINAGNWYHRFVFVVSTSIDTCLAQCGGLDNFPSNILTKRTAVYEFDYQRSFNETGTKAYYSFAASALDTVWQNYASEFGFERTSADLTTSVDGFPGITRNGQAAALMIKVEEDVTTIPYLRQLYSVFSPYIEKPYDETTGKTWDAQFTGMSNEEIEAFADSNTIVKYLDDITHTYSNEALTAVFGSSMGNMVTLAYILTSNNSVPERTVRGTAKYTATTDKLNEIVWDMDALITPRDGNEGDTAIANRVGRIVSEFFDTSNDIFAGTAVEGLQYENLHELVGYLVQGILFRDSVINALVEMIYPMVSNMLADMLEGLTSSDAINKWVGNIVDNVIDNNELAVYPNNLGDRLIARYGDKYATAANILKNVQDNKWENLNADTLVWGVDDASFENKAEAFTDALCAALCGFTLLLVTIMCGDAEYVNNARKGGNSWHGSNEFDEWYDKFLVHTGGQNGVVLRAQGGYTKLIVPLLRVLGLSEQSAYGQGCYGYLSSREYHRLVDIDGDNCLRMILEPIIYWVTNVLGTKPFETLWSLLPNLVNFFTRTSSVSIPGAGTWCSGGADNDNHGNFTSLQTHNLSTIVDNLYLYVTFLGGKVYETSVSSLLGDKAAILTSINALLNNVLDLGFDTDVVLEQKVAAYSDADGNIAIHDSTEYALEPERYINEHMYYYSNRTETSFSLTEDEAHPVKHENIVYEQHAYKIPQIQESKLVSCGTVREDWNTIVVTDPGRVLLYVLRFVCSALGYRYDADDTELPYLIECFGLDTQKELFQGLTLGDIIYNVMLRPDDAICALLELFYTNESGDYYTHQAYTYPLTSINYHQNTLLNKTINPTLSYGTQVKYSKYWTREYATDVVGNAGELVENILTMLGMTDFKDGIGAYLEKMLNDNVFNDKLVNTLFNSIYQLLAGLNESTGFNIDVVLNAALDVKFQPADVAPVLRQMLGYDTDAYMKIRSATSWNDVFTAYKEIDPATGEEVSVYNDVDFDWGVASAAEHGMSSAEAFLRVVSALLSPAAFAIRYLFMDYDLDILGLIKLPSYAGYQYAFIALLEALSCPNILTYSEYYEAAQQPVVGNANAIYNLVAPLLGLLDKVYADPINTILNLIPNLLFFISIGGLNDLLNNLVHFVYVLLDILKPIVNGYDLLGGLLSNLDVGGITINLSLPLDIDFNALASDLIGSLVGDALTINGVSITLPYIDFQTLCCGTLEKYNSREVRTTVKLNSSGGGDLVTAVLRLLFEVVFMEENKQAVTKIISNAIGEGKLDVYDEETLYMILDELYTLMETYELPDMLLYVIYVLVTKVTPITTTLAPRFEANGLTISELISSASDMDAFMSNIQKLLKDPSEPVRPGESEDMNAFGGLLARIKAFFQKLILFFKKMFGQA